MQSCIKNYRRLSDHFRPAPFAPRAQDQALAPRVFELAEAYQQDSDHQLAEKAQIVRDAIRAKRHPLLWGDFVLPTFALTTEAIRRTTGMTYYEVQLLAGLALSTGAIAEVQTGEGKTIVAALPCALHALAGSSVHVATVNAYLAERDYELIAPAMRMLGVTVGLLRERSAPAEKREVYQQDVVYGTGYEFGFDYLRDQAVGRRRQRTFLGERFRQQLRGVGDSKANMMQRAHHVAIVDEVDSVLIDEANTPLVLSGSEQGAARHGSVYACAARTIRGLEEKTHYVVDRQARSVQLTELGQAAIFDQFESLPTEGLVRPWASYVEQALRAALLLRRDVDYVVQEQQVKLVDQYTGRIFSDRRWRDGLHQAVQQKENVKITEENTSIARVSRQRYFGLYDMLCGMTGTATGHEGEFRRFYELPIVVIPPHVPCQRRRLPTRYFATVADKFLAITRDVHRRHETGQPILIGTKTIDESEALSKNFRQLQISHLMLNGKQDRAEADVIAAAGQPGAVTIATNMAGRGTDIKLHDAARLAGGLHVIQTQRQDSARVDRQLIGRCARQGQPGSHQCFVSAEDELTVAFGAELADRMALVAGNAGAEGAGVDSAFDHEMDQVQAMAETRSYEQRCDLFRQDQWLDDVLARVATRDEPIGVSLRFPYPPKAHEIMATVDNSSTEHSHPQDTVAASKVNPLQELDRQLKEAIQQSTELRPLLNHLLRLTSQALGCHYVGFFENNHGDEMVPTQCLSPHTEAPDTLRQLAVDVEDLKVVASAAAVAKVVVNQPLTANKSLVGIAAPVANPGRMAAALAVLVHANDPALRRKVALLDHVAGAISQWQLMNTLDRLNWEASASSAAVELVTEVIGSDSLHEAYIAAANLLKNLFACDRVMIAAYQPGLGKHEIQAISEIAQFDASSETVQAMAAAMDESALRDDVTVWPPLTPQQRHATLAHRRLAEVAKEEAIVTASLSVDDEIVGAVMFVGPRATLHVTRRINGIRAIGPHLAAALVARRHAEPNRLKRVLSEVFGRSGTQQRRYAWMLLLILGAVLPLVPWRYQVKADCDIEPVVRRFTVTPYEGILQKGLVEPGDLVSEGDVIARMDDRELRWKLASLGADLARASKERDAAMAKHDTSEKQIAVLTMESLKSEIELYQQRQRNLEISSPIDGVVLKGDLEDAEGSPVKTGETLYEIAPLSPLKAELAISEDDLPQTKEGMPVVIRLDGFAGGAVKGKIVRIHPRSEIRDASNVFIAEFEVDNEDGKLRPGMSGRARVRSGIHSLGWIWFHKAWHRARLLIGY